MNIWLPKYTTPRSWLLTGAAVLAGTPLALHAPAQGNAAASQPQTHAQSR